MSYWKSFDLKTYNRISLPISYSSYERDVVEGLERKTRGAVRWAARRHPGQPRDVGGDEKVHSKIGSSRYGVNKTFGFDVLNYTRPFD